MRKKTINFTLDKTFWYIVYFLPIIVLIIASINNIPLSLSSLMTTLGVNIATGNVIYDMLVGLFGVGGVLELFSGTAIFEFSAYMVSVFLIHFIIDVSLFIFKLARKWIDGITGGGD